MSGERWYDALARLRRAGLPHVLATQVTSQGSTPREPGARMVITADAIIDTLGGGTFEWQLIACARERLERGEAGLSLEAFSLGGRSGQCCGGFVNVLLETDLGTATRLALFGAGHVGRAVASLAAPLGWRLDWYDSREDAFSGLDPAPGQHHHRLDDCNASAESLPAGSHVLVLTHDHAEDYALVEALLRRGDMASIGLIGSRSKWASFRGRLERAGIPHDRIDTVRCPIGDSGGDKTPYAVALAALAELLPLASPRPEGARRDALRGLESAEVRRLFS
ncbi:MULTISPECIES: xanthine dehydrogenase accessory protein XdhC [unclassified Halomonas]|uniref:Xanthine dehydrogenase accessory protein XdhC n=1 Tax=Halomonas sp. H10-59 TaxID=2950874 RepID=A0AAU7KYM0_9GAMM|nr:MULTISPECIES: xanthine dehydrogenase accessory protein XdhC [unclassified Halomonas]KJZ07257.1 molybdenum cofactor sulfurylase [Halomonas sp. S2151]MCJ8285929.1 xanthine dehydrogenase accessory protein XdhC [Halomonas sp.]MCO7216771.1 xanthine dehydrogenase accessory protein XdhC [Halomonas sp. OfavH-34-E]NQY70982.1 xanthine dehydrogenase accessory protein XdhC [Halomonas sp.]